MTKQLRIRLPSHQAVQLEKIPPFARTRIVGLLVGASLERVDLNRLIEIEPTLRNLGTLLNQALRISRGSSVNQAALKEAVVLIQSIKA